MVLGKAVAWLTALDWRSGFGGGAAIADEQLFDEFQRVFELDGAGRERVSRFMNQWRDAVARTDRRADLVGELYELLPTSGSLCQTGQTFSRRFLIVKTRVASKPRVCPAPPMIDRRSLMS